MRRLLVWTALLIAAWIFVTAALVLALRWWNPPTSAFMLRARLAAAQSGDTRYVTHHTWVSYDRISPDAALAVIASEDQQFPSHWGFDLESIRAALDESEAGGRLRGASTISQQVAKNLFLWSGRSFVRKGLEAWFTALIEGFWPKRRILEIYLNIAELGPGIYGVEAAAQKFFHKPAARLNRSEAALLAAVLPNPVRLHADRPSRYVMSRRDWIMGQMRGLGGRSFLLQLEQESGAAASRRHPRGS